MDEDFIREQIHTLHGRGGHRAAFARALAACWPGGPADRSDPVAMGWLRYWRPATARLVLPSCSCGAGHCAVCN